MRTLRAKDDSHLRCTQPYVRLDKCIQHGLQIESRATDDLKHIGGGGLLLQAFTQLIEQSGILDGDDGLIGEALDQIDLPVGERPDLLAKEVEGADQLA